MTNKIYRKIGISEKLTIWASIHSLCRQSEPYGQQIHPNWKVVWYWTDTPHIFNALKRMLAHKKYIVQQCDWIDFLSSFSIEMLAHIPDNDRCTCKFSRATEISKVGTSQLQAKWIAHCLLFQAMAWQRAGEKEREKEMKKWYIKANFNAK